MAHKDEQKWNMQFQIYKRFMDEEARFPSATEIYKDFRLGQWLRNQVNAYKAGLLPSYRKELLDSVNHAWNKPFSDKIIANKELLLASNWKKHLGPGEVSIDQVFLGEDLYNCLIRDIYCCRDYINTFEKKFGTRFWEQLSETTISRFPVEASLFSLEHRKAILGAQFSNLDFTSFNIYIAVFKQAFPDFFCSDALWETGRKPTLFEFAKALSERGFETRAEMQSVYNDILLTLPKSVQKLVHEKFVLGKPDAAIAKKLSVTMGRIWQINNKLKSCLHQPLLRKYIDPGYVPDGVEPSKQTNFRDAYFLTKEREKGIPVDINFVKMPVEELDFSVRTYHVLKRAKINTLCELVEHSEKQLMGLRNMGKKSLREVESKLAELGLELGQKIRTSNEILEEQRGEMASLDDLVSAAENKWNEALVKTGDIRQGIGSLDTVQR